MSTPQTRTLGSIFELQFPQSVGIYSSYAEAQKAVDFLADEKFEVQNLAIVGTDLKSVERVLGRRTWNTVLLGGVQSGVSTGLLVALVLLIFVPEVAELPGAAAVVAGHRRPARDDLRGDRLRHVARAAGLHVGDPDRRDQVRGALRAQGRRPGPGDAAAASRRPRHRLRVGDQPHPGNPAPDAVITAPRAFGDHRRWISRGDAEGGQPATTPDRTRCRPSRPPRRRRCGGGRRRGSRCRRR